MRKYLINFIIVIAVEVNFIIIIVIIIERIFMNLLIEVSIIIIKIKN